MSAPALDRDRLLRDLRAASDVATRAQGDLSDEVADRLWPMSLAWRIIAAAIEDGDYDLDPDGPRYDLTPAGVLTLEDDGEDR